MPDLWTPTDLRTCASHKDRPGSLSETHKMPTAPAAVPTSFRIILLKLFAFLIKIFPKKMVLG